MKTVEDFKKKMVPGAQVNTRLYFLCNAEYVLQKTFGVREVAYVTDKLFALQLPGENGAEGKAGVYIWQPQDEFNALSENEAELRFEGGKLVFTFQ